MTAVSEPSVSAAISHAVRRLGYSVIRPEQKQVVEGFVLGRDVLVSFPTGSGKSLCFMLLPYIFDCLRSSSTSIVIVISPLIALMQDQVESLCQRGVRAAFLYNGTDRTIKDGIYVGE